jgi:alkanesulfonate monooxygenase SsuD/methylene tetrahydromethanopterin reductase-like flavin-dependent oxidoreductase (luciferase family)
MTALAGELADGYIIGLRTRRDEIPNRLAILKRAAERAGRDSKAIEIVKLVLASDGSNSEASLHQSNVRRHVARLIYELPPDESTSLGFDEVLTKRVRDTVQRGEYDVAARMLTQGMLDAFVASGSTGNALEMLTGLTRAGVDLPVLTAFGGPWQPVIELGRQFLQRGSDERLLH